MWAIFCSSSWLGGFDTRPPPPVAMANRATQRHPRLVKLGECALAMDQIKHANTGAVRARAVDVFRPVVGQTPWQEQYSGEVRGCPAMRVPPARWPLTCAPANLAPVQEFGTNARHTHSGVLESTANMIFAQSPEAFAALNGMEHRLRDLYKSPMNAHAEFENVSQKPNCAPRSASSLDTFVAVEVLCPSLGLLGCVSVFPRTCRSRYSLAWHTPSAALLRTTAVSSCSTRPTRCATPAAAAASTPTAAKAPSATPARRRAICARPRPKEAAAARY